MNLYAHQQALVDLNPHRHLLAWKVGTGKTNGALALAQKNGGATLVICTKTLKQEGKWERDWLAMNPPVPGIPGQMMYVVTKEEFRRDHKKLPRFDNVIWDEAHLGLGNMKSQLHKALMAYMRVHQPKNVWLLTGTPYTSSPLSIYSLARILGYKWDYFRFRDQFFQPRHLGQRVVFEPRPGMEDELANKVREIGSIVRMEDCKDVPEQTFIEESFPKSEAQKKWEKEINKSESNPLTRFGKLHQIAQGILIGNEYVKDEMFDALKNDRILELAQETEKLIVFSRFNKHLELLEEKLSKAGIPCHVMNGATPDKGALIHHAEESKRCVLLVQAECAEGWEAPSFDVMVFASLSYSYVKYEQAKGRLLRINNIKKNTYIILSTKDSVDEPVGEAMSAKKDFSEAIFIRQHFPEHDSSTTTV